MDIFTTITNDNGTTERIGTIRAMYLDYVNNFLTVDRFAEYYQVSVALAEMIIKEGRELHYGA